MSKPIKISETALSTLLAEIAEKIRALKVSDGTLNFTKSLPSTNNKTRLLFTHGAYEKMMFLVNEFTTEVAWYGVTERVDGGFLVTDILVYPQKVDGANVETDEAELDRWFRDNDEDDRMCSLYMQGHSHVNMAVSPSAKDLAHQKDILDMKTRGFYCFIITNKREERFVRIYDLDENVMYETADVDVEILPEDADIEQPEITGVSEEEKTAMLSLLHDIRSKRRNEAFLAEAKRVVNNKVTQYTYGGGYYGGYYGGYGGNKYGAANTAAAQTHAANVQKPDDRWHPKYPAARCDWYDDPSEEEYYNYWRDSK